MDKKAVIAALVILTGVLALAVWTRNRAPVPGSCLIFEEKYCKAAEIFDWQAPWGRAYKVVGFHLPAGAALFSPYASKGPFGAGSGNSAFGPDVFAVTLGPKSADITGTISAHGALRVNGTPREVDKGQVMAYLEDRDVGLPNGYNLVLLLFQSDEKGQSITSEELLEKFNY